MEWKSMIEQPQHYDEFGKIPNKRTYIRRAPKKRQEGETKIQKNQESEAVQSPILEPKIEKKLTATDLAASQGLTLEQYKERLSKKVDAEINALQKQIREENIAKKDLEQNIRDAYGILDYLQSPNRPDAGLLQLDPARFRKMRQDLDRLLEESAEPESGKLFVVPRIAALDATVEVLYELYEKERLDDQRSKPGILGVLKLLSKEKLQRAAYTNEVQEWARETRHNVRGMLQDLLRRPRALTPKEREIVERLQLQMDDLVRFTK
jgi:hypothetical protein